MIQPLSLSIGLRYIRAKRRNHFISFISFASMLGIALGVMVLITVLSVMNGFDYEIQKRFFAIAPAVTVTTAQNIFPNWKETRKEILNFPGIQNVAPYVSAKGMLINHEKIQGVQVMGILPRIESKVSKISKKIQYGKLKNLRSGSYNIVIGLALSRQLDVRVGNSINLLTPKVSATLAGVFPRYHRFKVSAIFHTGNSFDFENRVVYISMGDASRLFPKDIASSGFHVKLKNLYQARMLSNQLQSLLGPLYSVTNWTIQFGSLFRALAMEKTMFFFILLLIVAVAVFNLVSTLVMVVNDKRSDIAILRTLGASPSMIMRTIVIQGTIIGLVGILIGLLLGLFLASNVTDIFNTIQNFFHLHFLQSSIYIIHFLPSKIEWSDVLKVCLIALALSVLGTIYPALMAFRTQPAEVLSYR